MEKKAKYASKEMEQRREEMELEIANSLLELDEEELHILELFVEFLIWRRNR